MFAYASSSTPLSQATRRSYFLKTRRRAPHYPFHFIPPSEQLVDLDEEAHQYYSSPQNPPKNIIDLPFDNEAYEQGAAACTAEIEQSLSNSIGKAHPRQQDPSQFHFHFHFTEEFCDIDEDLPLPPPSLKQGETVTPLQLTRLLRLYEMTRVSLRVISSLLGPSSLFPLPSSLFPLLLHTQKKPFRQRRQLLSLLTNSLSSPKHQRTHSENASLLNEVLKLLDHLVGLAANTQDSQHSIISQEEWEEWVGTGGDEEKPIAEWALENKFFKSQTFVHGCNTLSWRKLIQELANVGRVSESFSLFERLESKGSIRPSLPLFLDLLKICRDAKRADKAMHYFKMLSKYRDNSLVFGYEEWLNPRTYNLVLSTCVACNEEASVLNIYKHMKRRHVQPDVYTYGIMINHFTKTKKVSNAIQLFDEMKRNNIAPSAEVYTALLKCLSINPIRNQKLSESDATKNQDDTSASIVSSVFAEMKRNGLKPDGHTYSQVMRSFTAVHDLPKTLFYFNEMISSGVKPESVHLDLLLTAYGWSWMPETAFELFVDMKKRYGIHPNEHHLDSLIASISRSARFDLVSNAFEVAEKEFGLRPNSRTFRLILQYCANFEDPKLGQYFYDTMVQKYNLQPLEVGSHTHTRHNTEQ